MITTTMELNTKEKNKIRELGINALILCGSRAQNIASVNSDYDFLVIGPTGKKIYDALYDLLSENINKLIDIDIVFESEAPLEFKNHAIKYGVVLYEKSPSVFANFKQKLMIEYADFAPHRAIFSNATLSRI